MLTRYRRHSHLPSLTVLTGDGIKTLDLSATTAEAWRLLFGGEQTPDDIERLYHAVGPLYTAVMARAQAIAGLPWRLRTARGAARPLDIDALSDLLVAAEIDYVLHGAAYWLRDPTAPLGLRRLHPRTMVVETDSRRGLVGLTRRIGEQAVRLDLDQVVWFWEPSASHEVGPGVAPAARAVAQARHYLAQEQYAAAFFDRGAIRPTVWTFQTPPLEPELERFRGWLERLISGVRNAFRQTALSQPVTPITIGDKLTEVMTPELADALTQAILTALSVPHSLVLPSAANYATAQRDWQTFILLIILPHARRLAAALTQHHYRRDGLIIEVAEEAVEAVQDAELAKAEALQRLVAGGILTVSEARLRLELPPIDNPANELARLRERAALEIAKLRREAQLDAAPTTPTEFEKHAAAAPLRSIKAPLSVDERSLNESERLLYRRLKATFEQLEQETIRAIERGELLTVERWHALVGSAIADALRDAAYDAALSQAALVAVLVDDAQLSALLYDWSMRHTQYLVDDLLWPTTRDLVQQAVAQWRATPGADRDALIRMLAPTFGPRRAETIAITAATEAATAGARAYRDLLRDHYGLRYEMVWYTAADERVCPICGALHQRREPDWASYANGPPAHPRCRCGVGLRRAREED